MCQTSRFWASDLGLHCLLRPVYPITGQFDTLKRICAFVIPTFQTLIPQKESVSLLQKLKAHFDKEAYTRYVCKLREHLRDGIN